MIRSFLYSFRTTVLSSAQFLAIETQPGKGLPEGKASPCWTHCIRHICAPVAGMFVPFPTVPYKMGGGRKWPEQCVCILEAYFSSVRGKKQSVLP